MKNLTFCRSLCPKHTGCHSLWPVEKRKGNQGRVKSCFGWIPPSDVRASLASPHSGEGIGHKSMALSAHFSKEKVYQGLCDGRVGALPIQNSLGSWGCAESSLLSHLCCQSTYPSDSGQGRNISRLNIFESFLCTLVSGDLACVHPVARKCAGEILIRVFGSGECLLFPRPALMPFHCVGLTSNSSWIIPSGRAIGLCQLHSLSSQLSFIRCQFLPVCIIYPADFSFTSCCPPRLLCRGCDNRLEKKKLYFNFLCELCLFWDFRWYHLSAWFKG